MKVCNIVLLASLVVSTNVFARGGDDVGNGGFAYRQSVIILKNATEELDGKIKASTLKDIVDHPERRAILQNTLGYNDLDKLSKKDRYRGGKKLAMDYIVNPATVIVLKPYFEAFAGKTDTEIEDASLEVQKRLLHEAAHIWGYKEDDAEKFALNFLANARHESERPSDDISISFGRSCLNGKSDDGATDNFCNQMPKSQIATLYLKTEIGPLTSLNSKLGNLYNWCNVQLSDDQTAPQCSLEVRDGDNISYLPVTITSNTNSLTVDVGSLDYDKPYFIRIAETKTGSNARTKAAIFKRVKQQPVDTRPLNVSLINQYTCMTFGGVIRNDGMDIKSYTRSYYYFSGTETPAPLPPSMGPAQIYCHDFQLHPGDDSDLYPRLELVPGVFNNWNKADPRFYSNDGTKPKINGIIEQRLANEAGIVANLNLFYKLDYANRPKVDDSSSKRTLGFVMVPFVDPSNQSFCPTLENSTVDPLLKILSEYTRNTQGLYLAEKEGEVIQDGTTTRTVYGTMLTTQDVLEKYGFYIENAYKVKATKADLHNHTIYFYWPLSQTLDPLLKGYRKLYTVKRVDELSDNSQNINVPSIITSDKKIGCIPR